MMLLVGSLVLAGWLAFSAAFEGASSYEMTVQSFLWGFLHFMLLFVGLLLLLLFGSIVALAIVLRLLSPFIGYPITAQDKVRLSGSNRRWMQEYDFAGYRSASLVVDKEGNFVFSSVRMRRTTFEVDASAECKSNKEHAAPDENCKCGFYAADKPGGIMPAFSGMEVILQCYYTGKVIPAEKGLRAERQHVTCVLLPSVCSKRRCKQPVENVVVDDDWLDTNENTIGLRPLCAHHASKSNVRSYTIQDVKESLLVDVQRIE